MRLVRAMALLSVVGGCVPAGGGDDPEPEPEMMLPDMQDDAGVALCDPSVPSVYPREAFGPCPSYEDEVARWGLEEGADPCPDQPNRRLSVGVNDPEIQVCAEPSECGSTSLRWYYCGYFPLVVPDPDGRVAMFTRNPGVEVVQCLGGWPIVRSEDDGCAIAIYADCNQPNLPEWRRRLDVRTCDEPLP